MSIHKRFLRFHAENLHVYDELVDLACQWRAKQGNRPVGILMFYDTLRWQQGVNTSGDPYRLNSNFTAYYARLIMDRKPDLRGAFETRASEADLFGDRPHPHPAQAALWADVEADTTWLDEANRVLDERAVGA